MKKMFFIFLLAIIYLALSFENVLAVSGTIGPQKKQVLCSEEQIKLQPELRERCKAMGLGIYARPSGSGLKSGTAGAGSTGSGSSEHGTIRGTINAGGDFIAPKIKDTTPKPRGIAPKLSQ